MLNLFFLSHSVHLTDHGAMGRFGGGTHKTDSNGQSFESSARLTISNIKNYCLHECV